MRPRRPASSSSWPTSPPRPNHVVGIGGSAGSIEAFASLLRDLDPDTGMAFVFILHLKPDRESAAAEVLQRYTSMPVAEAQGGMPLAADHVYVIPPNHDLLLRGERFEATSPRTMEGRHHQVDIFLKSLARDCGPRAVSVILSGGDGDGTEGCGAVKRAGGTTFAQDASAKVDSMPRNATKSGCVDDVLTPEQIAAELSALGRATKRRGAAAGEKE